MLSLQSSECGARRAGCARGSSSCTRTGGAVMRALAAIVTFGALVAIAPLAHADGPAGGVVIDVNGPTRGKYPIALPTAIDGDAGADKEVSSVMSFDMSVAGPFKVLDAAGFLADLKTEALGIDPAPWNTVGAYGVVKYQIIGGDPVAIEFRLFEVAKGNTPVLTKTYRGKRSELRHLTHQWCNDMVKYYTGENGFFGSKIAFTARGAKGTSAIYAMDFDGANAYSVSRNSSTNILPAWSPSGGQIAYTSFMRGNPDLYIAPAGGGRPKKISAQQGMNTGATWSPDGSQIALTLSNSGAAQIYVISASDGSIVRRLTNTKSIDTSPAWSPDGRLIAFVSDRNGGPQIFVMSAAGGAATQVSFNGNYNTTPTWSPKGHVIAYTTRDGGNYDIVTRDLDSKKMTRVTQNQGNNEEPAFSPNGKAIAFARDGAGVFHHGRRRHRPSEQSLGRLGDRRRLGPVEELAVTEWGRLLRAEAREQDRPRCRIARRGRGGRVHPGNARDLVLAEVAVGNELRVEAGAGRRVAVAVGVREQQLAGRRSLKLRGRDAVGQRGRPDARGGDVERARDREARVLVHEHLEQVGRRPRQRDRDDVVPCAGVLGEQEVVVERVDLDGPRDDLVRAAERIGDARQRHVGVEVYGDDDGVMGRHRGQEAAGRDRRHRVARTALDVSDRGHRAVEARTVADDGITVGCARRVVDRREPDASTPRKRDAREREAVKSPGAHPSLRGARGSLGRSNRRRRSRSMGARACCT